MTWALLVVFAAPGRWSLTIFPWVSLCYVFLYIQISLYSNNNGNPTGIHNYCAFKLYANGLTQAINWWVGLFLLASVTQDTNHKPPKGTGSYFHAPCFFPAIGWLPECSAPNGGKGGDIHIGKRLKPWLMYKQEHKGTFVLRAPLLCIVRTVATSSCQNSRAVG